jgi:hypothetical protein
MNRRMELRSRGACTASLCALAASLAIPAIAGAAGATLPRHLIDGSVPQRVPKALRYQGRSFVMTKVRIANAKQIRRLLSTCPSGDQAKAAQSIVERIGVNGRDITFLPSRDEIAGCDRNPRARAIYAPWCSIAGWLFRRGRVSNARLGICFDRHQRSVVAFGWINPLPHAQWIVVDQPGFREVYPVAAHLPVRVSTVSEIGSPTFFHTAQYDARGVLLARKTVTAAIAS